MSEAVTRWSGLGSPAGSPQVLRLDGQQALRDRQGVASRRLG